MSIEISTYLTGRYVSINCYTLSFKEYLNFKGKTVADAKDMFEEYLQFGGFPIIGISNFDTRSAYQVVMEFILLLLLGIFPNAIESEIKICLTVW